MYVLVLPILLSCYDALYLSHSAPLALPEGLKRNERNNVSIVSSDCRRPPSPCFSCCLCVETRRHLISPRGHRLPLLMKKFFGSLPLIISQNLPLAPQRSDFLPSIVKLLYLYPHLKLAPELLDFLPSIAKLQLFLVLQVLLLAMYTRRHLCHLVRIP